MKKLKYLAVLLLFLIGTNAFADFWPGVYVSTMDQQRIAFSKDTCITTQGQRISEYKDAFVRKENGKILHGCWFYDKDTDAVLTFWDNAKEQKYPRKSLRSFQ